MQLSQLYDGKHLPCYHYEADMTAVGISPRQEPENSKNVTWVYGLDNWAELRQHTPMDTIRMQLKTLNRQQGLYPKTKTMMKNNLIALLDQTYPGVNALFDSPVREDGSQKCVDFATAFWHVGCVRNMSLTAFTERYRKWCKRHG